MRHRGFTLIELMIVVAIIGILAAIAIPKFSNLIRKSNEGATRGNLGALRSALSIYYGDMEGQYPAFLTNLTENGKYLTKFPTSKRPNYHADSSAVANSDAVLGVPDDSNGWLYGNAPGDQYYGQIFVNCQHTDTKGSSWVSY